MDPRAGEASNREVAEDVKSEKTATCQYYSWWCIFAPIVVINQHHE